MKKIKLLFTVCAVAFLCGCTALGFVADMAIIKETGSRSDAGNNNNKALPLTELGTETDIAILRTVKQQINPTKPADSPSSDVASNSSFKGACAKSLTKDERCFSAEYYEQLRKQMLDSDNKN